MPVDEDWIVSTRNIVVQIVLYAAYVEYSCVSGETLEKKKKNKPSSFTN